MHDEHCTCLSAIKNDGLLEETSTSRFLCFSGLRQFPHFDPRLPNPTRGDPDHETNGEGVRLAYSGEFAYEAFDDEVYEEDGESSNVLGDNMWEHYNPCFLAYNGGYSYSKYSLSEEIETKRKVACWPDWRKVDEEEKAEGVECNFLPPIEAEFKQEMMSEFSTFKDYFWPKLIHEEGSIMREGYKSLRSALYNDICSFTPFYNMEDDEFEEVSEMKEIKLTFMRNREKAEDIFGKLYPDEFPVTPRERGVVIEMNRTWWKDNRIKFAWGIGGSIAGVILLSFLIGALIKIIKG